MARTVLPFVGAAIGFWVGGPTGAQVGFALGGVVGNAVDPVKNIGPRIGETGAQTSAEGAPRAIVFGTVQVTGNVIASGPLIKTDVEEGGGGKGGPVNSTERAFRFYAVRICEGRIGGVLRIWEDDKLVYDVRTGSVMLAESAKWMGANVFYHGDEDQMPDVFMTLNIHEDNPAYRGTSYMSFNFRDLTDRRGSIPQYRFEVARDISAGTPGAVVIGPTAQSGYQTYVDVDSLGFPFILNGQTGGSGPFGVGFPGSYDTKTFPVGFSSLTPLDVVTTGNVGDTSGDTRLWPIAIDNQGFALSYDGNFGYCKLVLNGASFGYFSPGPGASPDWWYNEAGYHPEYGGLVWFTPGSVYLGVRKTGSTGTLWDSIFKFAKVAGSPIYPSAAITGVTGNDPPIFWMHVSRSVDVSYITLAGAAFTHDENLANPVAFTLPSAIAALFPSSTAIDGFGIDDAKDMAAYVHGGTTVDVYRHSTGTLLASYGLTGAGTQVNTRVVFSEDGIYVQRTGKTYFIPTPSTFEGVPMLLSDIVAEIHDRCQVDAARFDVAELTDEVAGLVLAGDYTGADAINTLRGPYFFDKAEADGQLWYPKRGAAVVDTWTIDDLVDEPDSQMREQAIEYPKKFHLFYQHANSGYAVVKATSQRSSPDVRVIGEATAQVPVVLDENQAAQTAHKMHKVSWAEAEGEVKFSVPWSFISRVPSNPIGLYLRNRVSRLRITDMALADGVLDVTARHDRQSAYTSNVTGIPIPNPTPPPATITGSTTLLVLDLPSLRDQDDDLNIYFAVTGAQPGWAGAVVQRSLDGGSTWETVATITSAQKVGELTAALADASEHYTDTTNVAAVRLYRPGQTLESISDQAFLSEGGAFALENGGGQWEILQARDWDEQSAGDWHGSPLHRGRLNTPTNLHADGSRFVMLANVVHVPMESARIGQSILYRAPSLGQAPELAVTQERIYTGQSQREWPVASLAASVDGSDIMTATWAPRHRFGTDDAPVASINFTGFRATVGNLVQFETIDTTAQSWTQDVSAIPEPFVLTVQAVNRITGPGPASSVIFGGESPASAYRASGNVAVSNPYFAQQMGGMVITLEQAAGATQLEFFDLDMNGLGGYGVAVGEAYGLGSIGDITYALSMDISGGDSTVVRFDRTGSLTTPTHIEFYSSRLQSLTVCGADVWISDPFGTASAIKLDPDDITVANYVPLPSGPGLLASDGTRVFAAGAGVIHIIDNATMAVTTIPLPVPDQVTSLVFAAGALIVMQASFARVIDPATGAVVRDLGAGGSVNAAGNVVVLFRNITLPALVYQAANLELFAEVNDPSAAWTNNVFALTETRLLVATPGSPPHAEIFIP